MTHAHSEIFIHAILLRSACFPLMYHDDYNWKKILNEDMNVQQKNFEEITETINNKLKNLWDNRMSNAYRYLPIYLDKLSGQVDDCDLMLNTYLTLNTNFDKGYDKSTRFNLIMVNSTNVHYRSPHLFYYSNSDNKSIVVGIGEISPKYNCNEDIGLIKKILTCFKIGYSHISYHGDNVESTLMKSC